MQPTAPRMDAENTYAVFDWLWTSGQLSAADIDALPALGVETVINLALPSASNALPGEAERVTALGLNYVHIPVPWERPEVRHFNRFAGVLSAWAPRPTWVHCARNMRVSAFVYLYRRLVLGEPESVARFPMDRIWQPNAVWQDWINAVCSSPPGPTGRAP